MKWNSMIHLGSGVRVGQDFFYLGFTTFFVIFVIGVLQPVNIIPLIFS